MPKEPEELGDELCKWCPRDEKIRGVYSVPGGFAAGCEGSHCKEAYEAYIEECAAESIISTESGYKECYEDHFNCKLGED